MKLILCIKKNIYSFNFNTGNLMLTFRENESETAQGKRIKENVLKSKDNSKEGFDKSVLECSFFYLGNIGRQR